MRQKYKNGITNINVWFVHHLKYELLHPLVLNTLKCSTDIFLISFQHSANDVYVFISLLIKVK